MTSDLLFDLQRDIAEGAVTLDEVVTNLADSDRCDDIARLLARRLAVEHAVVVRALNARWQEVGAMLCRTAGLGANGYSAILRMRRRAGHTLDAAPDSLIAAYLQRARLDAAELAALLQSLALRTSPPTAPEA